MRALRAAADRWAGPAFLLVLLLSAYVLFAPDPVGNGAGPPGADKVVHAGLFALLAFTAAMRFGALPVVLAAAVAYGSLSEVVQWLALPQRSGDVLDLLADVVGAAGGWVLAGRLLRP